jgi:hypothetical protein
MVARFCRPFLLETNGLHTGRRLTPWYIMNGWEEIHQASTTLLSGGTLLCLRCALISKGDVISRPKLMIRTCGADLQSIAAHGMKVKRHALWQDMN